MMEAEIEPLFTPFECRGWKLPNRIVMAPMTRGFSPDGVPGPDVAGYYARRAAGGTALIVTEGVGVGHPAALGGAGVDGDNVPHMYGPEALEGWRKVVAAVHRAGGLIVPQLWHQGVMREKGTGPHPDAESIGPSDVWGPSWAVAPSWMRPMDQEVTSSWIKPMTDEDIADVIGSFVRSARDAMALGFDGIAIHGAHGYLVDTFLWEETNRRNDRWGGDIARRTAFAIELVKAIRGEVGAEPVIMFRFSQWKQQHFEARMAPSPAELEQLLGPIADAGVDIFDASQRRFDVAEFEGSALNLAGWAKKLTGRASVTVGSVGLARSFFESIEKGSSAICANIAAVAERLARGEFDLVGVGRALLHDPCWASKVRAGEPLEPYDEKSRQVLT